MRINFIGDKEINEINRECKEYNIYEYIWRY